MNTPRNGVGGIAEAEPIIGILSLDVKPCFRPGKLPKVGGSAIDPFKAGRLLSAIACDDGKAQNSRSSLPDV